MTPFITLLAAIIGLCTTETRWRLRLAAILGVPIALLVASGALSPAALAAIPLLIIAGEIVSWEKSLSR